MKQVIDFLYRKTKQTKLIPTRQGQSEKSHIHNNMKTMSNKVFVGIFFHLLFIIEDISGHTTSQITEMYYVKKDTSRLNGITDGFELWKYAAIKIHPENRIFGVYDFCMPYIFEDV